MQRIFAQAGIRVVDAAGRPSALRLERTQPYELWPANVRTWQIWLRLQSQWRSDMGVRTGLDHGAAHSHIEFDIPRRRRDEVREHIYAMERAALTVYRKAADERQ